MKRVFAMMFAAALTVSALPALAHSWQYHYSTEISYRVINVASWDVLNVRSGPYASRPIVGTLKPGEGGLIIETCARHARWCLVNNGYLTGWVSMKFLGGYAN